MTSRVLDALKVLEDRRRERCEIVLPPVARPLPVERPIPVARPLPIARPIAVTRPVAKPLPPLPQPVKALPEPVQPSPEPVQASAARLAAENMCLLPTVPLVAGHYLDLARRIGEQLTSSYCAVLAFVACDDATESCFSMTHLAQAFSQQSAGGVLLVDGDLRRGRLSKSVCPAGPGLIEAMTGAATWPEIVHPTSTPRVDFVACGNSQVPTFERPQFGWGALRPKYRAVLIGVGDTRDPETSWLAARCDAVYFVLSRQQTRRRLSVAAVEALRSSGANVLGCVVTED